MSFHYRWFSRDEELTGDYGERRSRAVLDAEEPRGPRPFSRGETLSLILATLMLGYGVFAGGAPFVLAALAFLSYELRRLTPLVLRAELAAPVAQGMKSFGLVGLFGAVVLLFL